LIINIELDFAIYATTAYSIITVSPTRSVKPARHSVISHPMSSLKTPYENKAVWTKYADQRLIDGMGGQCEKGKKLDNGFKKKVWQEFMEKFNKDVIEKKKTVP